MDYWKLRDEKILRATTMANYNGKLQSLVALCVITVFQTITIKSYTTSPNKKLHHL
ncbi:hypothetical protein BVRB_1g014970 [Beta vulgaris subsp. vulgaris]|nr:hypothetical protein BVRB_1g014970 [Beta vulgaris subsp. vulgaris]